MKNLFTLCALAFSTVLFSQVGIGTITPEASSALDINSTTSGILIPRMTQAQRDAIATPATGLLVYQIDNSPGVYSYNGTWTSISSPGGGTDEFSTNGNTIFNDTFVTNNFVIGSNDLNNIGPDGYSRFYFYKAKGAFRGGVADNSQWDDANVGLYSSAFNQNTIASGEASTAFGNGSIASGAISFAVSGFAFGNSSTAFQGATASGEGSTAMGQSANASGDYSTAIGQNTIADQTNAIAIGNGSEASAIDAISMGKNTEASGTNALATGLNTIASGTNATAMGNGSIASGDISFAVNGNAFGNASLAMQGATAFANNTIAIGQSSNAFAENSIAIGNSLEAPSFAEVVLGSFNDTYTPNNTTGYDPNDRIFSIANGSSSGARSNALTILKSGSIGVGTPYPQATLDVLGTVKIFDGTQGVGKVLTSDANGNATWQAGGGASGEFTSFAGIVQNTTDILNDDFVFGSTILGGAQAQFYFDKSKAAFRAGQPNGTDWNDVNVGLNSVAFGFQSSATGANSTAFSASNANGIVSLSASGGIADGDYSIAMNNGTTLAAATDGVAIGNSALASQVNAIAMGNLAEASAANAVSIGKNSEASSAGATALGQNTVASGINSVAIGFSANALGQNAVSLSANANGNNSFAASAGIAGGNYSTALNEGTTLAVATDGFAVGNSSSSGGVNAIALGNLANASATNAVSIGKSSTASGIGAVALGENAIASGLSSGAFGNGGSATGTNAVALAADANGDNAFAASAGIADGDYSTALNNGTTEPTATNGFAMGDSSNAAAANAIAMGNLANASANDAVSIGKNSTASGISSVALGRNSTASGADATVVGFNAIAVGVNAVALSNGRANGGNSFAATSGIAGGAYSTALNRGTTLTIATDGFAVGNSSSSGGVNAIAMGNLANASATNAVSIGKSSTASGTGAVALGENAIASGLSSGAFGNGGSATGTNAVALAADANGDNAFAASAGIADGDYSTALNNGTTLAAATDGFAVGNSSVVSGANGVAIGIETKSKSFNEVVIGSYNLNYTEASTTTAIPTDRIFVVGNGNAVTGTSNALTMLKNGKTGFSRVPTTNILEVEGEASKTTAGAWVGNSDKRLKKNIETISEEKALESILKMRGVTYEWNDDKTGAKRPEGIQYGFVAQELQQVFPEKVTEDALGYLQTAYGDYDPIMVQSIKALHAKIENLIQENVILKAQINEQVEVNKRLEILETALLEIKNKLNP